MKTQSLRNASRRLQGTSRGFLLSRYSMRKKVLSRREQQTHFSIFICSEETRGCSAQIVLNHVRPKRKGVCVLQSLVHSQKGSQSLYVAYSRRLWHPTAPYLEGTGPLRVMGGTLCLNFPLFIVTGKTLFNHLVLPCYQGF